MQTVRPCAASDRDACLAHFDGNTPRFYARFGFEPVKVTPDGFGPGIDQWDMVLQLPV